MLLLLWRRSTYLRTNEIIAFCMNWLASKSCSFSIIIDMIKWVIKNIFLCNRSHCLMIFKSFLMCMTMTINASIIQSIYCCLLILWQVNIMFEFVSLCKTMLWMLTFICLRRHMTGIIKMAIWAVSAFKRKYNRILRR